MKTLNIITIKNTSLVFVLTLLLTYSGFSQNTLCHHDFNTDHQIQNDPDFLEQMMLDQEEMQNEMLNNPQAIMNGETYTIPIVFHVLHKGEPVGVGSNISNQQIYQALSDLNADFSNASGSSYDVGIQFCLAQQDPDGNSEYDTNGNNITGIQRVDASGVPNFLTFGIWSNQNEIEAKALSNWPESKYVNVWIAHRLYTGKDAAGFAYFPAAGDDIDGIALRSDATGIPSNSKVITHEAGHFFGLYHTFHNGDNDCPINSNYDCSNQGDMICQTRTHKSFNSFPFPCDESQYTSCDPTYNAPYLVTENHMNYTDNNCRNEFVPQQAMNMRCALMNLRGSLMNSIGCTPGCQNVTASFSPGDSEIETGTSITFVNSSTGASSYTWRVNGNIVSQSTDLVYNFTTEGFYEICLDAEGTDCAQRVCVSITVQPLCAPPPYCQEIINYNFEQIEGDNGSNSGSTGFANVCSWNAGKSTPYFCKLPENNSVAVRVNPGRDRFAETIVTHEEYELEVGSTYCFCFDYLGANEVIEDVIVGWTDDPNGRINNISEIDTIAHLRNVEPSFFNQPNHECYPENTEFKRYCKNYTHNQTDKKYLILTALSTIPNSGSQNFYHVYFDNIELKKLDCCTGTTCNPLPDFDYDPNCAKQFQGQNTGDGDNYTWNFLCNNITLLGQNVSIDLPPGNCNVCLTISCDQETSNTICKVINIQENNPTCEDVCTDITIPLQTCKQDTLEGDKYIATVDLEVPDGTTSCDGVDILSGSPVNDIVMTSISTKDHDTDPNKDIITIGIEVNTAVGVDLLSNNIDGVINLCAPNGDVICYNVTFTGDECDVCLGTLMSQAQCINADTTNNIYQYAGSITLPSDVANANPCGISSSATGFEIVGVNTDNDGNTVLNYNITNDNDGNFSATTILCFKIGNERKCIEVTIIPEPCMDTPEDCIQKWAPKSAGPCRVEGGMAYFNFSMNLDIPNGYQLCEGGAFGSVDGGMIMVNHANIANRKFRFDIDIIVPCGFTSGDIYDVRLYFCDSKGNTVCWHFPLILKCEQDCGERNSREVINKRSVNQQSAQIYPNPANNLLYVEYVSDETYEVQIVDQLGRQVHTIQSNKNQNAISTEHLSSGIHFIKILDNKGQIAFVEKILILK